jgi:nickel transport protein
MIHQLFGMVLLLGILFGHPQPALAHSVQTDYLISPQHSQMQLDVGFSTGEKFPDAPVAIFAPNQATIPWRTGKTDAKGHFIFQPDPTLKGNWTVTVGDVNTDHGDILTVPMGDRGIEAQKISALPSRRPNLAIAFLGVASWMGLMTPLGQRLLRPLRQRLR